MKETARTRKAAQWMKFISWAFVILVVGMTTLSLASIILLELYGTPYWLTNGINQAPAQLISYLTWTGGRPAQAHNIEQVGYVEMSSAADVWLHQGYAYVGTFRYGCPATGVRIVDVRQPAQPHLVGSVAAIPGTSQEDNMVLRLQTPAFSGDLLAIGIQSCRKDAPEGLDLWNVTDPRQPRHLAFWEADRGKDSHGGVHELYLFQQGERAFVAATLPHSHEGTADLRLIEVTDPKNPQEIARWGLVANGGLAPRDGQTFYAHSAHATADGTKLMVSYWDAGVVVLDISTPARPKMIGRTQYPSDSHGGSMHSVWLAHDEQIMLTADEVFDTDHWGRLRLWDISNISAPAHLSDFATANAAKPTPLGDPGRYTIHNPYVQGQYAYLAWYSDGVRVLDISNPRAPREIAYFVPPDHPDQLGHHPNVGMIWGLHGDGGLIVASDMNAGLYVLKLSGHAE